MQFSASPGGVPHRPEVGPRVRPGGCRLPSSGLVPEPVPVSSGTRQGGAGQELHTQQELQELSLPEPELPHGEAGGARIGD